MKQRTTEWVGKWTGKVDTDYHKKQFKEPYRSTVHFCDWLEKIGYINSKSKLLIMDLCSGQGANIYYMSKRYPLCKFVGIDLNHELVSNGNDFFPRIVLKIVN